MRLLVIAAPFLLLLAANQPSEARIWYVPSDAPTIEAGVDSAVAMDDCITMNNHATYRGGGISL